MMWLGHLVTTRLYFGRLGVDDTVWSIAPDLLMALFLTSWTSTWAEIGRWNIYSIFYKVPHSLWVIPFIRNDRYRNIYAFHILMDILSHSGQWSIEPFFPFEMKIHGIWDPIEWV